MEQPLGAGLIASVRRGPPEAPLDGARLRAALRDLASAIGALHAAGKLHLAISPAAVMIDPDGRARLLDPEAFAALTPPPARGSLAASDRPWSPSLAPEQAAGAPPTPACDWYAFGALLYEALTGRPPFGEGPDPTLEPPPLLDAPDPRLLADDLPDDLCDLAVDLLQRRPEARPTGAALLAALGAPIPAACAALTAWEARLPFVAREAALASLDEAFSDARAGATVTLHLHGSAGMGKSALLRRFLDRLAEHDEALLLEGPCLPGSPRPYEGIAAVIEALAAHLRTLPTAEIARLLPREASLLLRLFPVLASVPALAAAPRVAEAPDPREQRRRAVSALRALLRALAAEAPLVLAVDHFEHASADGAALLADLLEAGELPQEIPPPLLLLLAYRSEDAPSLDLVRALRRRLTRGEVVGDVRELLVEPLSGREARTLARLLLAARAPAETVARLARESGGSPRLLRALAEAQGAPPRPAPSEDPRAAEIAAIDPAQAGDEALAALAYHHAAACYRRALAAPEAPAFPLREKLIEALVRSGQADEAAQILLASIDERDREGALDRRVRAADQLLRGGQIAEGLALSESALASLDLALPVTGTRALASLVFRRAQLTLRGLGFSEQREAAIDPAELRRFDRGAALAESLSCFDPVRATDLDARLLLLALRLGEPGRVARALAREAWISALEGGARGRERAAALIARAAELGRAHGDPAITAWIAAVSAGVSLLAHRFREAVERAEQAIPLLRESCAESGPRVFTVQSRWLFPALYLLGDLRDLARRVPVALREAEQRGALDEETALRTGMMARVHFLFDRPIEALADSAEALRRWSPRGFHETHLTDLFTRVNGHLYEGDAPRAVGEMRNAWPVLERSQLLRGELVRIEAHALRAQSAHAAARWSADRETLLRVAERDARLLAKEGAPLGSAFSHLAFAGTALGRGHRDRALAFFERAEIAFAGLGLLLHAAVARRRRGELIGGDTGRALVWSCDEWMIGQEIKSPERMAAMLAPW